MKAAVATAGRILRQLVGDPRTLLLIFVAPVFVVFLLNEVVSAGDLRPRIALVGEASRAEEYADFLRDKAEVLGPWEAAAAAAKLESGAVDAVVDLGATPPLVTVDAADPATSAPAMRAIQAAFAGLANSRLPPFAAPLVAASKPETRFINGSETTSTFDFLAPVLLGFIVFFFTFILSGIAFLSERLSGTLERSLSSGATRGDVVVGYIIGYGLFALLQTVLFQSFMIYVIGIRSEGSFFATFLINFSLALSALSLGSLVSAFARTEFQVFQFIPLVVIPQILFSGILDLRASPGWVQVVSKCFPLTYAGDALRNVMLRGQSLASVGFDLCMVFGFSALFIVLNVLVLRRSE